MTIPQYTRGARDPRADAFGRVQRAFRWTVFGSVTAVAAIFGVVAHQIPGRSAKTPATSGAASVSAGAPANTGTGNSGTGNTGTGSTGNTGAVAAPTAPVPTQRAPTAVSGGTGW